MSRRRVSVKDLGEVDLHGWLHRRKDGRSFLGSRWKRSWFVLKKTSLYWYKDQRVSPQVSEVKAETAEGFMDLSGFRIQESGQSRRKHTFTATHPLVVTMVIAAETSSDMNRWITKLSRAAESCDNTNTKECYSEDSDQDSDDSATICSQDPQDSGKSVGEALPCPSSPISPSTDAPEGRAFSSSRTPSKQPSWLFSRTDTKKLDVLEEGSEAADEKPCDEMEELYVHLKAAHLTPMGLSNAKDFRTSFIRRSKDDRVNEELHQLRILRSTLKAKQEELMLMEQILVHPDLTAALYREWKVTNAILLQVIRRYQAAGGTTEQSS